MASMIYLDHFILVTPANSLVCASSFQVAISVVAKQGFPWHPQKCLGPASCMVVLGIELHSAAQIARLLADTFYHHYSRVPVSLVNLEVLYFDWSLASCMLMHGALAGLHFSLSNN